MAPVVNNNNNNNNNNNLHHHHHHLWHLSSAFILILKALYNTFGEREIILNSSERRKTIFILDVVVCLLICLFACFVSLLDTKPFGFYYLVI